MVPGPVHARRLEDGRLYGLGSNDDGASVVALIEAFKRLTAKPQPYTLVLSLSAEEESSGRSGLEISLKEIEAACGPIACGVFGEPTSLEMVVAEKGLMVLDWDTPRGIRASMPSTRPFPPSNGSGTSSSARSPTSWARSR